MTYLFAIVALSVLIIVHEAGHMWVARLSGMRVEKFSLFFGPALVKWRRGDTLYQIGTIPLGGFVQIAGMNPEEDLPADDPGSYENKATWKRIATIAAGPGINYLFAIALMLVLLQLWGLPQPRIAIGTVFKATPAAEAGMKKGDEIKAINGRDVESVAEVQNRVRDSSGRMLSFTLIRAGRPVEIPVTPTVADKSAATKSFRIGIGFAQKLSFMPIPLTRALKEAVRYPIEQSKVVLSTLSKLFSREIKTDQVGGPIEIVHQLRSSFQGGLPTALTFLAMLNVYLGLFNLLPIPALDGGRILFLLSEVVTRRKVNHRVENAFHTAGFFLLLCVLLLVTVGDVRRRFF